MLTKLTDSAPAVPSEEKLEKFERQISKIHKLRQINHAEKQCYDRASHSPSLSPRVSQLDRTSHIDIANKSLLQEPDRSSSLTHSKGRKSPKTSRVFPKISRTNFGQNMTAQNSQTFQQQEKSDKINPFSTRSQSIGIDGTQTSIDLEAVKKRRRKSVHPV